MLAEWHVVSFRRLFMELLLLDLLLEQLIFKLDGRGLTAAKARLSEIWRVFCPWPVADFLAVPITSHLLLLSYYLGMFAFGCVNEPLD